MVICDYCMKVAFLVSKWPVEGGIETVTRTLANEMVKRGHHVVIMYTEYFKPDNAPFVDERITEVLISRENSHDRAKASIAHCIEFNKIEVVINQCFPTWSAKVLEDLKYKVKIIECMHMILFYPSRYNRLGWKGYDLRLRLYGPWLCRYVEKRQRCEELEREFPYVDRFVLLSKAYVDEYFQFRGTRLGEGILTYMNNPLTMNTELSESELHDKENVVLCVARMSEIEKRISFLIDVWKEIEHDSRFNDWYFDLVGTGPSLSMYKERVKIEGIKRIRFYGYQQPDMYYRKSKIFLMSSIAEGWGMTLVEAQQLGTIPIVLDTFSSLHDIVIDGYNGRIVRHRTVKAFVKVLKNVMTDDRDREKMALNAIKTCKRFNVKMIVDKWEKLINDIHS